MYLITIHVPIYLCRDRCRVTTEWRRSLCLLRDSLRGRFGPLGVLAPCLPQDDGPAAQLLEPVTPEKDDIRLIPSFPQNCRTRQYWLGYRRQWRDDLRAFIPQARVVHAGMDDVYRPISFEGHCLAVALHRPTVFVQDIDPERQAVQLARNQPLAVQLRARACRLLFHRCMCYGVRTAALSLLKGRALLNRYTEYAANPRVFQETSFGREDIVASAVLDERVKTLHEARPLRYVYCGPLEQCKGVHRSLQIVARVQATGRPIQYDIIGDGPQRGALERQVAELGLGSTVRFLGKKADGHERIQCLAGYDALLFTPTAEDAPQMVFDAYAAGLPIVGYAIECLRECSEEEHAVELMPFADPVTAADALVRLDHDRGRLVPLARAARRAAQANTAEAWYRRRAEWTFEAVERFHTHCRVPLYDRNHGVAVKGVTHGG